MRPTLFLLLTFTFSPMCIAQNYTSFLIGNPTDITTVPTAGTCLMGGAGENDEAMTWFLERANGGDVLVLRATGGDGYNSYFYNDLGVTLNSVETIRLNNASAASDPYVLNKITNAEAIWFAGGNQATYVTYLKDSPAMELLNNHINVKQAPIGGISAGMAIMSEFYFDAINGSVTSTQALNNPFASSVSIGQGTFLENEFLTQIITDTHFDNPNRKGRITTFLARIVEETGERAFGIAADEFTAICIDEEGIASIYGQFPQFDDYAYFVQVNCIEDFTPETLQANTPLTWNRDSEAIKVYKVPGVLGGNNTFNLSNWEEGNGGTWQNWWITNASFNEEDSSEIECETLSVSTLEKTSFEVYPNPATTVIQWRSEETLDRIQIFSTQGRLVKEIRQPSSNQLSVEDLATGAYFLKAFSTNLSEVIQFVKK